MSARRTYLDHNATAPLRPEARAAMLAAIELTGNASSVHTEGRAARRLVEAARAQVAALVDADPVEVVFTSGATEANNWVMRAGWDVIAVAGIEHDSVLAPARVSGSELVELTSGTDGVVALEALSEGLRGRGGRTGRRLLSLHAANAETGVIQPVAEAAALARECGAVLHTDAVQAVGRVSISCRALGLDLVSVSAHKLGGPKGIGALIIRDGVELPPLLLGGGQEGRRRAGTENIAAIAGFGAAAQSARLDLVRMDRLTALRYRLEAGVREFTPGVHIFGQSAPRLPNTTCMALPGLPASTLLIRLDLSGIAVSAGSACSSGKIGASQVLKAMGVAEQLAASAIRVSLGSDSTDADVDHFIEVWAGIQRDTGVRRISSFVAARERSRTPDELTAGE